MTHETIQLSPEIEQAKQAWRKAYASFCERQGINIKTVFRKKCFISIGAKTDEHTPRLTLPLPFEDLVTNIFGEGAFVERVDATKTPYSEYVRFSINVDSTKSTVLKGSSIDSDKGPRVVSILPNGQQIAVTNFISFNMRDMTISLDFSAPNNREIHTGGMVSESSTYVPHDIPLDLANIFPELLTYLEGFNATTKIWKGIGNEDLLKAQDFVSKQELERYLEKIRRQREATPKLPEGK